MIEGWHLFEEAVQAGVTIEKNLCSRKLPEQLAAFSQTVWVSEDILLDLADSQTHRELLRWFKKEEVGQADLIQGKFLFLEDVQDPGNVGTIIRTADAAGFTGVIVSDRIGRYLQSQRPYVPCKAVIFICLFTGWLVKRSKETKEAGIPVLATTPV